MHVVEPKVFLVAETGLIPEGVQEYLDWLGIPDWVSDAPSDAEKLIEICGRMCYRSFEPGLNKNVRKVREGNKPYIYNILKSKHGSVTEHPVVTFIFADVSRVFTHELVRHRQGVAISQESLRFVRLTDLGFWAPTVIKEDKKALEIMTNTIQYLEMLQGKLSQHFDLDDPKKPFGIKKVVTSAMRRIAPIGLATSISWSCNLRALRWIIQMRTHRSAEEEIRVVFAKVAEIAQQRYPNIFQDFSTEMVDGLPEFSPEFSKV